MISLVWVLRKRRDLLPVWALAFSGMILIDHQIFTGLQIQNYHYVYVFGPMVSVLVISAFAAAAQHFEKWKPVLVRVCLGALCVGSLVSGLWLRTAEAEHTKVPLKLQSDLKQYRLEREAAPGKPPIPRLVPDSVVAGDLMFSYLSSIQEDQRPLFAYAVLFSPSVSDEECDRRAALNGYVIGQTAYDFHDSEIEFFQELVYGPAAHDLRERALSIQKRDNEFRKIQADPEKAIRDFNVRYIALTGDQKFPPALTSEFELFQNGPGWVIWARKEQTPSAVVQ
jgi:hypothetical protein